MSLRFSPSIRFVDKGPVSPQIELEEAYLHLIYGHVRQGKTLTGTQFAVKALRRGEVVYTTWALDWPGYDERKSWWCMFWALVGLKKTLAVYPASNWRYLPIRQFWELFPKITDAHVMVDEAVLAVDSYVGTNITIEKRIALLLTGHFNRSITLIVQRPTSVNVNARGTVAIFWKCKKFFKIGKYVLIQVLGYEDMMGDTVNEEAKPTHRRYYLGRPALYKYYDSKYMRGGMKPSQERAGEKYEIEAWSKLRSGIGRGLVGLKSGLKRIKQWKLW